jgi:hypothetical protein
MATKGRSKPGERRGGRKKGSLNKPRIVLKVDHPADRLARQAEAEVRAAKGDPKRCKDILSEWANLCSGIASRFRPTLVNGKPTWNTKDELELFDRFIHKSCLYAHWGAPYEDPTYRAIAVVSAPSDTFARGQPSNVVDIRDAQTAANEYRRIVCGTRA